MNKAQLVCLWVGIIVIAAMCFYPPEYRYKGQDRVNVERLIPLCIGVGIVITGLIITLNRFRTLSIKELWNAFFATKVRRGFKIALVIIILCVISFFVISILYDLYFSGSHDVPSPRVGGGIY